MQKCAESRVGFRKDVDNAKRVGGEHNVFKPFLFYAYYSVCSYWYFCILRNLGLFRTFLLQEYALLISKMIRLLQ